LQKKQASSEMDQDINTNWLSKYRPRMKDLRRPAFCPAAKLKPRAGVSKFEGLGGRPQRIGDGCVARFAAMPALRRNQYCRYPEAQPVSP
jgi:hypothetical protein